MKSVMMVLLAVCALGAAACEEKKPEAGKPAATATGAAKPAPAPAKTGGGGW